jgi:hypothetical protein
MFQNQEVGVFGSTALELRSKGHSSRIITVGPGTFTG